jgi:mono/diheme cytochrome c family protein
MNRSMIRIGQMLFLGCALVFILTTSTRADDSATVYKAKCAVCHAADGSGSNDMGKKLSTPDLRSDDVQKQTDAQLTDSVANGKGKKMPAYKGKLTDDQIKDLVGYIHELAKKK